MKRADRKRTVAVCTFVVVFTILSIFIYRGCRELSIQEAENSLTGFLLNHKAVHNFVAEVQRPEVYRLQSENKLYKEYFSPILLSRTFIARNIKDALNREREKVGLEPVSFKLAAKNPRNTINAADDFELDLLEKFNSGELSEFKSIRAGESGRVLYYAVPVDPNKTSCLRCHGDPAGAPKEMVEQYGDQAGFSEAVGDIRALVSMKLPLEGLLSGAGKAAFLFSAITFVLLSAFLGLVFLLFKQVDHQREVVEDTSYFLDSILQSTKGTAIIAVDNDDVIVYVNQEAERLLGNPGFPLQGLNLSYVHKVFAEQSLENFEKKLRNVKNAGRYRFSVNRNGMVLDVRLSTVTGMDGRYKGMVFIGHDITEQVAAKKEQEAMAVRLQRAEKMESVGLIASGVAHDLNNILAGITSYPELILMNLSEESRLWKPIKSIEDAGLRAAAVVDDLLTVARGAAIVKEVCNLNELISEYMATPEHRRTVSVNPGVVWGTQLEQKLKNVECAPIHFKKCMMNLICNGVEAMEGEGHCLVSTFCRLVDEPTGIQVGLEPGEYSVVVIQDTGPGIKQEDLDHVFEPFYTKKQMGRSGTGLGLAVVWNAMQDHDGAVLVQSVQGEGTSFELYFPVTELKESGGGEKLAIESLQGNNELILVVDDEEGLRDIAAQKLIALGYRVKSVASGEEAVEFLEQKDVDFVLLDMIMDPGINGYETYRRIIEFKPDQKAVIVSGYSRGADIDKAKELGVYGFMKKPYTITQLGEMLQRALTAVEL